MIYYKVTHKYKLIDHVEKKNIGVYSSLEKANNDIKELELRDGFIDTKEGFPNTISTRKDNFLWIRTY